MERTKMIKKKAAALHKYKHVYSSLRDKSTNQARFLYNKVEQIQMELNAMRYA